MDLKTYLLNEAEKYTSYDFDVRDYRYIKSKIDNILTADNILKNYLKDPGAVKEYINELKSKLRGNKDIIKNKNGDFEKFAVSLYIIMYRAGVSKASKEEDITDEDFKKYSKDDAKKLLSEINKIDSVENTKLFNTKMNSEIQKASEGARKESKEEVEKELKSRKESDKKTEEPEEEPEEESEEKSKPEEKISKEEEEKSKPEEKISKEEEEKLTKDDDVESYKHSDTIKKIKEYQNKLKEESETLKGDTSFKGGRALSVYAKSIKELGKFLKKAEEAEKDSKLYPTPSSRLNAFLKSKKALINAETTFKNTSIKRDIKLADNPYQSVKKEIQSGVSALKKGVKDITQSRAAKIGSDVASRTLNKITDKIKRKSVETKVSEISKELGEEQANKYAEAFVNNQKEIIDEIEKALQLKKLKSNISPDKKTEAPKEAAKPNTKAENEILKQRANAYNPKLTRALIARRGLENQGHYKL
jgi:hypothetical protein